MLSTLQGTFMYEGNCRQDVHIKHDLMEKGFMCNERSCRHEVFVKEGFEIKLTRSPIKNLHFIDAMTIKDMLGLIGVFECQ